LSYMLPAAVAGGPCAGDADGDVRLRLARWVAASRENNLVDAGGPEKPLWGGAMPKGGAQSRAGAGATNDDVSYSCR